MQKDDERRERDREEADDGREDEENRIPVETLFGLTRANHGVRNKRDLSQSCENNCRGHPTKHRQYKHRQGHTTFPAWSKGEIDDLQLCTLCTLQSGHPLAIRASLFVVLYGGITKEVEGKVSLWIHAPLSLSLSHSLPSPPLCLGISLPSLFCSRS